MIVFESKILEWMGMGKEWEGRREGKGNDKKNKG
jgi:hypothetical protein